MHHKDLKEGVGYLADLKVPNVGLPGKILQTGRSTATITRERRNVGGLSDGGDLNAVSLNGGGRLVHELGVLQERKERLPKGGGG